MSCRIAELRCKEVVNVRDGARLGFVSDVEVDVVTGRVAALTVPGKAGLGIFSGRDDYVIPWEAVCRIGDDIVLVDFEFVPRPRREKKNWF